VSDLHALSTLFPLAPWSHTIGCREIPRTDSEGLQIHPNGAVFLIYLNVVCATITASTLSLLAEQSKTTISSCNLPKHAAYSEPTSSDGPYTLKTES
jgi:hypothetical protein